MDILIADDHAIVRKGLVQILRDEFPTATITETANGAEVFEKIRGCVWDFILLDISMPGRNGLEVLKQLRLEGIKAPVLMLSMHPEEQYAIRVLKSGASGFLNKNSATEELIHAVKLVLSGRKYISSTLAEKLALSLDNNDKQPHELLSDRELQVFEFLAGGKSLSEIADEISLSVSTVSTYRSRILEKMNFISNSDLTRYALENDLLE